GEDGSHAERGMMSERETEPRPRLAARLVAGLELATDVRPHVVNRARTEAADFSAKGDAGSMSVGARPRAKIEIPPALHPVEPHPLQSTRFVDFEKDVRRPVRSLVDAARAARLTIVDRSVRHALTPRTADDGVRNLLLQLIVVVTVVLPNFM